LIDLMICVFYAVCQTPCANSNDTQGQQQDDKANCQPCTGGSPAIKHQHKSGYNAKQLQRKTARKQALFGIEEFTMHTFPSCLYQGPKAWSFVASTKFSVYSRAPATTAAQDSSDL